MGLFDFFKKKKKSTKSESGIEIASLDTGSHGDHFGGLFGFDFMSKEDAFSFVFKQIDKIASTPILARNSELNVDMKDMSFDTSDEDRSRLKMRVFETKGEMLSAFPYLKTKHSIPFSTRVVHPWSHVGEIEAEVYGAGRNTFALGFFATDYVINEEKYKNQKDLDICISAIGLVLDKFASDPQGELKFDSEFASYMPNGDIDRITYYDFIGKVLELTEVNLTPDISGYILRVKLINDPEDSEFFNVDMFINKENIRIDNLEIGMSVTGALWFQGEIKS